METTMELAIEMYSGLNNKTFNETLSEMKRGNENIIESVKMLMFSISK